jgi:hypothetical protein
MSLTVTRITWRINKDLEIATGFSCAFWRKMVLEKKIDVLEVEGRIALADEAVREFLNRRKRKALNQSDALEVAA